MLDFIVTIGGLCLFRGCSETGRILWDIPMDSFYDRYWFRRPTIIRLHEEFREGLERDTKRKMTLTPILSLLLYLRFLATGTSLLIHEGDSLHISRNASGREIRAISSLIVRAFKHIIDIPLGDMAHQLMEDFCKIAGAYIL